MWKQKLILIAMIFAVICLKANIVIALTSAQRLAIIQEQAYVARNHKTTYRFQALLESLLEYYLDSIEKLTDISIVAKQALAQQGIDENLINLMTDMVVLAGKTRCIRFKSYNDHIAAYCVFRIKGFSRFQSINQAEILLKQKKCK